MNSCGVIRCLNFLTHRFVRCQQSTIGIERKNLNRSHDTGSQIKLIFELPGTYPVHLATLARIEYAWLNKGQKLLILCYFLHKHWFYVKNEHLASNLKDILTLALYLSPFS